MMVLGAIGLAAVLTIGSWIGNWSRTQPKDPCLREKTLPGLNPSNCLKRK